MISCLCGWFSKLPRMETDMIKMTTWREDAITPGTWDSKAASMPGQAGAAHKNLFNIPD